MKPFHSSYITQICDFRSNYDYIENLKHPPKVICPSMRFKYHGEKSKNGAQAKAINFKNQKKKGDNVHKLKYFPAIMGMFPLYVELHPQIWEMLSNIFIGSFHVIFSCPHVRPNTSKPYTPPCAFGINTHAIDIHFTFYPCHSICKAFSSAGIRRNILGLGPLSIGVDDIRPCLGKTICKPLTSGVLANSHW